MPAKARREIPGWLLLPVGVLVVSALLLTVPLWIPVVMVWDAQHRRRLRRIAESFRCSTCGSILAAAALRRADDEWEAYVRELMQKNPGVRFRLVRTVHAICLSCGTPYRYVEQERTFVVQQRGVGRSAGGRRRDGRDSTSNTTIAGGQPVNAATSWSDAITRWIHDELYGRPWSPRPPKDKAGFVEGLERMRRESRERLATLVPAEPASPQVRVERVAIYLYASGLAALGKADALPDVFDHWDATSQGSELWRPAPYLAEGLPLPRHPDGIPDLAAAVKWIHAHVGELAQDGQAGRFAMPSR